VSLIEILLPRTDGGAAFQAVAALPVFAAALVAVRGNRDLVVFVTGLTVLTYAWFALRTVH
jgi:hypothetical protein